MAKQPHGGSGSTDDSLYDLVSVLYHALQGAETYATYIDDAEGDEELVSFFNEVKAEEERRAKRARELLAHRLPSTQRSEQGQSLDLENAAE
jgi:hypothetical protein